MHTRPVALVTGGSRGIGRGVCVALSEAGYAVAVNYAGNEAAALETRSSLDDAIVIQGDVSRRDDHHRMLDAVLAKWGRLDVLVNNAGITSQGRKDILDATEESWDAVLGVNLRGPFFLTQLVANAMVRIGVERLHRPAVINITSLSAVTASVNRGDYCISKAGMAMLTQLYALRLAAQGIRVYEVRPGIIETDMTAGALERYRREVADGLLPMPRLGTPGDVGQVVAMLATHDLAYSTGEVFNVDGGFHLRRL